MRELYHFVLLLALAFGPSTSFGLIRLGQKRFVRIVNNLQNKELLYDCRSHYDDFGDRVMGPNQEWEWKFHLDSWFTFHCDFWHSNSSHHARFDVFRPSEDFIYRCGGAHCIWRAEEAGFSLFHIKTGKWEKEHDWEYNNTNT